MPFNGSGTFTRVHDWTTDAANAINNEASRQDAEDDNFAAGLSSCITKDGQTTITANIPLNGFKITGLGNGTNASDAVNKGQLDAAVAGTVPVNASYVTLSVNATLTGERVLTGESGVVSLTDGGAGGNVTIGLAAGGVPVNKLVNAAAGTVLSNVTGGSAAPAYNSVSSVLDVIGSTSQNLLVRGASAWGVLAKGTAGQSFRVSSGGSLAWENDPVASVDDQVAGTSATKLVTPSVQGRHPSAVKAYVRFNSNGTIQGAALGVQSVTKLATGQFRVTFFPAFAAAPSVVATANSTSRVLAQASAVTTVEADILVSLISTAGAPSTDSFTDISVQVAGGATA